MTGLEFKYELNDLVIWMLGGRLKVQVMEEKKSISIEGRRDILQIIAVGTGT